MRIRLSQRGLVKQGMKKAEDEVTPRRLLFIAALHLHEPDTLGARYQVFRSNKVSGSTTYLDECASGSRPPIETETQDRMHVLVPERNSCYLYICAYNAATPTHYGRLKKRGGLWYVSSRRLVVLAPGKALPGDGVKATWPNKWDATMDPDPDRSINTRLVLSRVLTGGASVGSLAHYAEHDYETRRQLSQMLILGDIFQTGNVNNTILVREGNSSISLTYDDPGETKAHGWVEPLTFHYKNIVAQARPACPLRPITFRSDGFLNSGNDLFPNYTPRCILPVIRDAFEVLPYPWPGESAARFDKEEREILDYFLLGGLLPLIGITRDDNLVEFYGLSLHIKKDIGEVVRYGWNRALSRSGAFPVISIKPEASRPVWTPNTRLVDLMAAMIYADNAPGEGSARRLGHLLYILQTYMNVTPKHLSAKLVSWGAELTPDQETIINSRLAPFAQFAQY